MTTLTITLLFAVAVGVLTAAATAVRSVSRIWLRHWAEHALVADAAAAGSALERPHRYFLAAGTGIAALAFALGSVVAFRAELPRIFAALGIAILALLVFGQVVPRAIARRWATLLVPALAPLLRAIDALFGPALDFAARAVRALAPSGAPEPAPAATDPLEDLLREGELEGIGQAAESEIISGVAEFGEKAVRAVMTPWAKVTTVSAALSVAEAADVVARSGFTRVPIVGRDGAVIGVVHAFDVLGDPTSAVAAPRPVARADGAEPCGAVMRRLLREQRHMAVVYDAGRVVGAVTLEDLVEELVGDIHDEHDDPTPAV